MKNNRLETIGTGSFCDEHGNPNVNSSTLVRKWRVSSNSKYFITFFALFWNICMWSIRKDLRNAHDFATVFVNLLFPAIGLYFAYLSLAIWINKTIISFDAKNLKIRKTPLPWRNEKLDVSIQNINSVYVVCYSSHYYGENDSNPVLAYKVMAQVKVGPDICIDQGFANQSDAIILEAWLNHNLKLADFPKSKFPSKSDAS